MKAVTRWLGAIFVAFSIGTVISLAVISSMLWWKGVITDERMYGMLAALQSHSEDGDDHNLPLMTWYAMEPLVEINPERTLTMATNTISQRSASPAAVGPSATWLQSSATSTNAALPHAKAAGIASGLTPSMNRAAQT